MTFSLSSLSASLNEISQKKKMETKKVAGNKIKKNVRLNLGNELVQVSVSNLSSKVVSSDLRHLFTEFKLITVTLHFTPRGIPLGTGVISVKRSNAEKLVSKYDGVKMDGQAIHLEILEAERRSSRKPLKMTKSPHVNIKKTEKNMETN